MHESTMVTTYTITSSSFAYCGPTHADPQCGGTWSITSKVRETLASALAHVHAMNECAEYPTGPVAGGTVRRPSFRYTWELGRTRGRAHDMVIIVPDQH